MPTVTVHYDGWVQLPERLVRSLGLRTGDRLEVELAEGGILLRAVASAKGTAEPTAGLSPPPSPVIEEHTREDAGTVPDEPQQVEPAVQGEELVSRPRARGRRKTQPLGNG